MILHLAIAAALAGPLLCACTYDRPRRIAQIQEFQTDTLGRTAIAQRFMDIRFPRGLAAFPDGGRPRIVLEAASIFVCDARTRSVDSLATLPKLPTAPELKVVPVGWGADAFFAETRGYASPTARQYVRIDLAGSVRLIADAEAIRSEYLPPQPFCQRALDSMWSAPSR